MTTVEPACGILKKQYNLDELEQRENRKNSDRIKINSNPTQHKTTTHPPNQR